MTTAPLPAQRPRALYILGAPGSGKSTLLSGLISYSPWAPSPEQINLTQLLRGHLMVDPTEPALFGLVLGSLAHGGFPGTDALSMAVAPQAREWVEHLSDPAEHATMPPYAVILGEGARLGNQGFLRALAAHTDLALVHLSADPILLEGRRAARARHLRLKAQSTSWARSAASGARNAFDALVHDPAQPLAFSLDLDTSALSASTVLATVRTALHNGGHDL